MRRASFNDGWEVRPRVSAFMEKGGRIAEWTPVHLPHDVMIGEARSPEEGSGNAYFPGGTWDYRKTFAVPAGDRRKRIFIEFEGVYRDAKVMVNGSFATHHPYGYTGFAVPIDHLVRHGEDNEIRVEVVAQEDARWYSGAGIYRNVKLIIGEPVHIALDSLRVTTPDVGDGYAVVEVQATIENDGTVTVPTSVEIEIVDDVGDTVATAALPLTSFPGRASTVRRRITVSDPYRWGLDSPRLYTCRVVVRDGAGAEVDADATTFGVRTLQLDAVRGLRINGEEVLLRGACIHHDNGVIGAATIERADERRIEILRDAGFNAIRMAHHPASKALLDACDRLGVLVMDEAFDSWTQPKMRNDYARVFTEWWESDIDAMVLKDRNHPSVILYSIGNEIPDVGVPAGAELGRRLADRVRALADDTRFVTNGVNPIIAVGIETIIEMASAGSAVPAATSAEPSDGEDNTGVNTVMQRLREALPILLQSEAVAEKLDEAYSYLDVAGYNYSDARYALDGQRIPSRVIVGSETHNTKIGENWPKVLDLRHVIGDFTWTGWDYLGEVGMGRVEYGEGTDLFMAEYPWLTSWCADIDITGHRRTLSYLREIVFGLRSDPYISVQSPLHHGETPAHLGLSGEPWLEGLASWTWPGFEHRPVTVDVLSDADEVELLVNGASVGRQPTGRPNGYRTEFDAVFEPGEVLAVAYRGGTEVGRTALQTGIGLEAIALVADRTEIRADDTDLAFLSITLVDRNGVLHHSDDRSISVEVTGVGVLQGLGSANPCTEESFVESTHATFHGRALAVVRPTGPGPITVTVTSKGLDPQSLTIDAVG